MSPGFVKAGGMAEAASLIEKYRVDGGVHRYLSLTKINEEHGQCDGQQ